MSGEGRERDGTYVNVGGQERVSGGVDILLRSSETQCDK